MYRSRPYDQACSFSFLYAPRDRSSHGELRGQGDCSGSNLEDEGHNALHCSLFAVSTFRPEGIAVESEGIVRFASVEAKINSDGRVDVPTFTGSHRLIVLNEPTGLGKFTCINSVHRKNPKWSVLAPSNRQALAQFQAHLWNLTDYKDLRTAQNWRSSTRLSVCMTSIKYVHSPGTGAFDVIIIDEADAVRIVTSRIDDERPV